MLSASSCPKQHESFRIGWNGGVYVEKRQTFLTETLIHFARSLSTCEIKGQESQIRQGTCLPAFHSQENREAQRNFFN